MSVINSIPLIAAGDDGYQISRSVRLRSSASAYFNRTMGSPTSLQKMTWSCWVKRGALTATAGYYNTLFGCPNGTLSSGFIIAFADYNSGTLRLYWNGVDLNTSQVFRDPSAWYHIVVAIDTTQATAANRVKFYVNGSQVTTFGTATYPTQNSNVPNFNNSGVVNYIGLTTNSTEYLDGYLTEINFIDGQQVAASSFGETDAVTGVWKPKKYAGTYGTNGFYLNFSDNSNNTAATIGKDWSGNGNNWTPNNISVTSGVTYDSMLDTPTPYADGGNGRGNYAVLNAVANTGGMTLTNGNLKAASSSVSRGIGSTIAFPSTGKYYAEITINAIATNGNVGICSAQDTNLPSGNLTGSSTALVYHLNGTKYVNGTNSAYGSSYTNGDVIGIAVDVDGGTVTFYKNNTSQGAITYATAGLNYIWFTYVYNGNVDFNFGQRPFAYTPPTGFKALNTQNLPDATIKKGNAYFDATTYTGNASTLAVTNAGFQPDLVWMKNRASAYSHGLYDSVRGAGTTKGLYSNETAAEGANSTLQNLVSFDSSGFTLGSTSSTNVINTSGQSHVAWQWKESVSAGFDIVTYTGTGSATTVAHSLGVAPKMIIVKTRSGTDSWVVYNSNFSTPSTDYLLLNSTAAKGTTASFWNGGANSSTFGLGAFASINANAATYVAYLFSEVAGYSKFGSYTGNGSTDGPFVYCGFRPRWIMIKSSTSGQPWIIVDTARNTYNVAGDYLSPDSSGAENYGSSRTTATNDDILSNGFKLRNDASSSGYTNASGQTYIYAAFAEVPFRNSLAR